MSKKTEKSRNIWERLLLFFTAVPALITLLMLPFYKQIFYNLIAIVFISLAAREMGKLLKRLGFHVKLLPATIIGALLPTVRYLEILLPKVGDYNTFSSAIVLIALASLAMPIFLQRYNMRERLFVGLGYLIVMLYPSFLGTYTVALTAFSSGPLLCLLYIVSVQANDSFAWVFGMLFGKNRGLIDVSPNKSIQGFLGGLIATIVVFVVFAFVWPQVFRLSWYLPLIALAIGICVILGDLVESLVKRAAEVKDSGTIIRGRGGALDSIDSLLFVAPLYYYFLPLIMVTQN